MPPPYIGSPVAPNERFDLGLVGIVRNNLIWAWIAWYFESGPCFDLVFDTVGLEISRQQAIHTVSPGGTIIHVGLTQPAGSFNFRKLTIQEVTIVGTYCYTKMDFKHSINLLEKKKIGSLDWIEYRELKEGAKAFEQIHNGSCIAPKIVLIPWFYSKFSQ